MVLGPQTGQARYPFMHNPEIKPFVGKSETIHIRIPFSLKHGLSILMSAQRHQHPPRVAAVLLAMGTDRYSYYQRLEILFSIL
jgi:hypothetical protein